MKIIGYSVELLFIHKSTFRGERTFRLISEKENRIFY